MKQPKDLQQPGDGVKYLTTGDAARACDVSLVAVKKWIRQGKLRAIRTPGGHFRIPVDEFERFRAEYRFGGGGRRRRILVVDDEPDIVAIITETLRADARWEIAAAANGYEGLLKVGTFRPDLLVLDLRMPRIDGFEVCRRVKGDDATRATKILAISGFGGEGARNEALGAGADAFLAKPFFTRQLDQEVRRLLGVVDPVTGPAGRPG
jgi:excisionase family DNA binding protein